MLIIEERPEKSFLTFLLRRSLGAGDTDPAGATSWGNLCSVLERVVAAWMGVNILSFKQKKVLVSERHSPFRGRFFFILLWSFLCCAWISCLHYRLCIPLYPRFWELFLLFSLESSFEHHPMSFLPSLPLYFVSTVNFHALLSSYKIRPSIWLIIPGSEVSKSWNKTTKCSTAFPEGSDDMHVHTAAQAFWPFRRVSKEHVIF